MGHETYLTEHMPEKKTGRIKMTLLDEDTQIGIPGSLIVSLTLTLFDKTTGAVINGRDHVNVLNTNGGTVDSAGKLVMQLAAADMVLLDGTLSQEQHGALFEWTYTTASGVKSGGHTVWFSVFDVFRTG